MSRNLTLELIVINNDILRNRIRIVRIRLVTLAKLRILNKL